MWANWGKVKMVYIIVDSMVVPFLDGVETREEEEAMA